MRQTQPRTRPRPAGFSIIEMLVLVSIILILSAIGIGAISQLFGTAEARKTQAILRQLGAALTEYTAHTRGSQPLMTETADPEDPDIGVVGDMAANGGEAVTKMLATIRENNDGQLAIDAWGRPIVYINGLDGRSHNGTISGQPLRPLAYFASAGEDGEWGEFQDGDVRKPDTAAADNLFSFEVGQ